MIQLQHNIEVFADQLQVLQDRFDLTDYRLGQLLDTPQITVSRWKKSVGKKEGRALPRKWMYEKIYSLFEQLDQDASLLTKTKIETVDNVDLHKYSTDDLLRELKRRGYRLSIEM